jgi:SulP family sulfate permease
VQIPSPARFAALPLPKLAVCLREGYPARLLAGDLLAGVTVGLVALPLVLLFAMSLTRHIPLAILAGILLVVAYDMGEWREIPGVIRLGPAEAAVWGITATLTVLADLTVAVEAGMILAALLYIRRVTTTTTVARVTSDYIDQGRAHSLQSHQVPDGVAIFRIHGPFLFGSTDKLQDVEAELPRLPPVVVLRLRNMTAIDGTGLHAVERLAEALRASGRTLLLCGMRDQPARMMERAEFHQHIGDESMLPSLEAALGRARELISESRHRHPEISTSAGRAPAG